MQRETKGPRNERGNAALAARRLTASTVCRLIGIPPRASRYKEACDRDGSQGGRCNLKQDAFQAEHAPGRTQYTWPQRKRIE